MTNLMNIFFGPLDKGSCVYFLIICGIFLFSLVIILFSELLFAFRNFEKLNFKFISNGILILFNVFLAYFVNRLFYNMCTKSLA
jgi:hypothetical protein